MGKFEKNGRQLPDTRATNAQHELWELLFIALAGVLCGAKSCCDMALFALDGKALRGAYERGKASTPLQMVNVSSRLEARLVAGGAQGARPQRSRRRARGTAHAFAGRLYRHGRCAALHRRFAAAVLARGADYALALKENQAKLHAAVAHRFARRGKRSTALRREASTHDRAETRRATVIRDTSVATANRFPGVVALARITSRRRLRGKRAEKPAVRYYLLSKSSRLSGSWQPYAAIGASRTACIGCSTPSSTRMPTEAERTMPPRTSRSCDGLPSISSAATPRRYRCVKSQTRRMGRCLPPRYPQPYAIALLLRGGYP